MSYKFTKKDQAKGAKVRWERRTPHGAGDGPFLILWHRLFFNRGSRCGVDISDRDIKELYESQNGLCKLSGLPMVKERGSIYSMSVDRIDNNKGYILGNIRLVCQAVNMMRRTLNDTEFISICKKIAENCL